MKKIVFAAALLASCGAMANIPKDARSASEELAAGLQAMSIITPDPDWLDKWNSSPTPSFETVSEIDKGRPFTFVAFLAKPAVDAQGNAKAACDVKMIGPDGKTHIEAKNQPCFEIHRPFHPQTIHLSKVAIRSDGNELKGRWTFELVAHDLVSGAAAKTQSSVLIK